MDKSNKKDKKLSGIKYIYDEYSSEEETSEDIIDPDFGEYLDDIERELDGMAKEDLLKEFKELEDLLDDSWD